ncbi:hypothetical protein [Pontibacter actiniarum]|uniref:Tetratricopeptide repeat protein n=1 Tax=Pontibacter actiniarum TaxID=323450 RepID=A0A1X9YV36_9BACT|nr:hypothetical protein [Pontibacter actiniarum]ARS36634.1 hypothetical protein CA264_15085 [Pontibacter actiniarum]
MPVKTLFHCLPLLFLLSFFRHTALGQEVPDYTRVYHPVINQAELRIVEKDYQQALEAYKQAFASVPSPFARDYYNAAVTALLLHERKETFRYLEGLVKKGVSLEYLERQPVFDSLRTTRHWRKFARKYPKRRRKYDERFNQELRADLDELYARDQYFREAEGGWRVHGDTIKQIEVANTAKLLDWIETYGYPGEDQIGVADTLEQLPRFSIVIVRQTLARKGYDFSDVLTKAVQQGRIAPQPVAYLLDQQAGRNKYGSRAYVRVNCTKCSESEEMKKLGDFLVRKLEEEELQRIDARRQELGLEPLWEYQRKIRHNAADDRFKLNYTWSVANFQVPSNEAAKVLLDGLTLAE